jgi:hypothetical protein
VKLGPAALRRISLIHLAVTHMRYQFPSHETLHDTCHEIAWRIESTISEDDSNAAL